MVVASDSGIDAGAIQAMGLDKILRVQELALENKLPFIHLVESAGANLMRYRVEGFVHGGALFRNLARLSAAGIPVITVQHGSGTAGGAYMPGLSDVVIMVRKRSRAFLAGPPLLMAATGEVATEEELGGAEMHTAVSGLGEYLAEDDRHALGIAREVVAELSILDSLRRAGMVRMPPGCGSGRNDCRAYRRRGTAGPGPRQPARAGGHARDHRPRRRRFAICWSSSRFTGRRRFARRPPSRATASASSPTTGPSTWPAPTRPRTSSS